MKVNRLESGLIEKLRHLGSCSVANAIEPFGVRLRNTGFTDSTVRCIFTGVSTDRRLCGDGAGTHLRSTDGGRQLLLPHLDWLDPRIECSAPRILVLQDMDQHPGLGLLYWRRSYACACRIGMHRRGDERRGPQCEMRYMRNSSSFKCSRATYLFRTPCPMFFDFGTTVEVGHMEVRPGDLLHGDRHGIQTIPLEIAHKIPAVAQEMIEQEREIIKLCHSLEFHGGETSRGSRCSGSEKESV